MQCLVLIFLTGASNLVPFIWIKILIICPIYVQHPVPNLNSELLSLWRDEIIGLLGRKIEIEIYMVIRLSYSNKMARTKQTAVKLLEGKLRIDVGRFFCCWLPLVLLLVTSLAPLATMIAAATPLDHRSIIARHLLHLPPVLTPPRLHHPHLYPFTCYRPGPPLDQPRWTLLHFMTPLAFGHPLTLLEDEIGSLTDDLTDRLLLRLSCRAHMPTPFALHPHHLHPLTTTHLCRLSLLTDWDAHKSYD